MKELNEKYGEEYKKRENPDKLQQYKSWRICGLLKSKTMFNDKNMKEVEMLMQKYPIMEMVSEEEVNKADTQQWSWVKRNLL